MNDLWRKSSYSTGNGECVEIAGLGDSQAMRDSKDPTGPVLSCGRAQWMVFAAAISRGEFG